MRIRWVLCLILLIHFPLFAIQPPPTARDLIDAVYSYQIAKIRWYFWNGGSIHARDRHGFTALHEAARMGRPRLLQYLLLGGADPNAVSKNRTTPLMLAAQNGHLQAIRLLLGAGADPNIKNAKGKTAMELAKQNGQTAAVEILQKAQ